MTTATQNTQAAFFKENAKENASWIKAGQAYVKACETDKPDDWKAASTAYGGARTAVLSAYSGPSGVVRSEYTALREESYATRDDKDKEELRVAEDENRAAEEHIESRLKALNIF